MKGNKTKQTVREHQDEATGKLVRQLTSVPGNHHHLYFTSSSFTRDNDHIIFISDSWEGEPNLFKLHIETGETVQLTENRDGSLKSYVYYEGNPYRGLGKASPSYNPATNQLLYIQGNDIRLLDIETLDDVVIYTLPNEVMTGFTHLSTDGRYACVPYISAAAFDDAPPGKEFPAIRDKVKSEGLESHMLVIDTEKKTGEVWFSQVGWITHVQFHPEDDHIVLYNHEGGQVGQRIWMYDHGEIRKVRNQSVEQEPIWICHEMWQREGESVIYHGTKRQFTPESYNFVGSIDTSGKKVELAFPPEMKPYGHFTVSSNEGLLVTDGIIGAKSIHLCHADWKEEKLSWTLLCEHNSSFSTQDVHPHPIFSHDDRFVLFTSDTHNERQKGNIYLIEMG